MNYYRQNKDGSVEVLPRRNRNCWFKSWDPLDVGIWYWIAYDGFTKHTYIECEVPSEVLMTALLME